MIGIVDYGMGNLRSLKNAIDYLGIDVEVVADAELLGGFSHLALPGVGAFGRAMEHIRARGLDAPLREHVRAGKPLLGICLGMQLLASRSFEFGEHEGLGFVPGQVVPFHASVEFPVPHVGWNTIERKRAHPLLEGAKEGVDYYFVHSFHFHVEDAADRIATTGYGIEFASVVGRGNVIGFQFHPEKSQAGGLALLERFAAWG